MINPFHEINWKPTSEDIRKLAVTLLIGSFVVSLILLIINCCRMPFSSAALLPLCFSGAGILVFVISLFAPPVLIPLYYVWFFVSACIGIVISNLILVIFFYLIFSLFALCLRILTRRDPLGLKRKTGENASYWIRPGRVGDKKRYLEQY